MSDQKPKGIDNGLTNYGDPEFASFLRRSMARSMGVSRELLDKPVVGIAATPSEFNNCHRHVPELAEAVARGVFVRDHVVAGHRIGRQAGHSGRDRPDVDRPPPRPAAWGLH